MGCSVVFEKGVIDEIATRARTAADEVCGLLLGEPGNVVAVVHCANVAAVPASTFEIDPARLLATHRAARAGGLPIVGCYHSHPGGAATPSPRDAADAAPNGWLWLIVGERETGVYRAVDDGHLHGRFDPVAVQRGCTASVTPPQRAPS